MCSGGGGRGTIVMPKTDAYDRLAQQQIDAMRDLQDGAAKVKQQELSTAQLRQQEQLTQLRDLQIQRANDVSGQAARLAALIGTPPPEKAADAPVVGRNRGPATSKGKAALRIERAVAAGSSQGAGLNIT